MISDQEPSVSTDGDRGYCVPSVIFINVCFFFMIYLLNLNITISDIDRNTDIFLLGHQNTKKEWLIIHETDPRGLK